MISHMRLILEATMDDGTVLRGQTTTVPQSIVEGEDLRVFSILDAIAEGGFDPQREPPLSESQRHLYSLYKLLLSLPIVQTHSDGTAIPNLVELCYARLQNELRRYETGSHLAHRASPPADPPKTE